MKVLFCTNAFEKVSNGPAKFAHLLLNESQQAGFETRILTEDTTSENPSVYKVNLHIPKIFKILGQFIRMWRYYRTAMKIRKKFEFDFIVYNNATIGILTCIFFKRTVGMINDDNSALSSFTKVFKRKVEFNSYVVFHYVEYLASHLFKCIIVNSEYLKKNLIKQYNCKPSLLKVMHKGIENKLLQQRREKILIEKTKGSILFVKTDFIRGGLYILIDALKNIERNVTITIVGPHKRYHEGLKRLLNEYHITFELFDYMPPNKVFDKMRESEIFCVPSKLEAFGVANLEAMALGCKIVSTNIGGIPEAVGGNCFTWLVEPDDPVSLRTGLVAAMETSIEEDLNNISEHLGQFSVTKVILRFKEILSECL